MTLPLEARFAPYRQLHNLLTPFQPIPAAVDQKRNHLPSASSAAAVSTPASSFFDSSSSAAAQAELSRRSDEIHSAQRSETLSDSDTLDQVEAQLQAYVLDGKYGHAYNTVVQSHFGSSAVRSSLLGTVIEGLCRSRRFRQAWQLYAQLSPDSVLERKALWLLLRSAIQAGQPQQAIQVFRHMQQVQLLPTLSEWCQLIGGLAKQRQKGTCSKQLPWQLWQELQHTGLQLDEIAYSTGMQACVVAGRLTEARQLLDRMRAADLPANIRCYNILLNGYARQRRTQDMEQVLSQLRAAGLEPTGPTYNTLLNGFIVAGEAAQARETMRQARTAGMADVRSYTTLVKGFVMRGHLQAAADVLTEMHASGIQPNEVTYSTLMEGYARQGDVSKCKSLVEQMHNAGLHPNALIYNILLHVAVLHPVPDMQAAGPVLKAMAEDGHAPGVDTVNTLMQAALKAGLPGAVPGLFRQLLQAGLSPSALSHLALITALTRLDRSADAVRAFEVLKAQPGIDLVPPAITAGATAYVRNGKIAQAEELLEAQPSGVRPAVQGWGALVAGHVQQRALPEATAVLARFCELGGCPDARMVDGIVGLCMLQRDRRHAAKVAGILEQVGAKVSRSRLARALDELENAESSLQQDGSNTVPSSGNVYIERFKFWIGLPNKYYQVDDWPGEGGN